MQWLEHSNYPPPRQKKVSTRWPTTTRVRHADLLPKFPNSVIGEIEGNCTKNPRVVKINLWTVNYSNKWVPEREREKEWVAVPCPLVSQWNEETVAECLVTNPHLATFNHSTLTMYGHRQSRSSSPCLGTNKTWAENSFLPLADKSSSTHKEWPRFDYNSHNKRRTTDSLSTPNVFFCRTKSVNGETLEESFDKFCESVQLNINQHESRSPRRTAPECHYLNVSFPLHRPPPLRPTSSIASREDDNKMTLSIWATILHFSQRVTPP